ncbi:MAG: aspartyl/asparaginyl beta-hydroxylase domain-containing protein [Pseudomonadota bacterium]
MDIGRPIKDLGPVKVDALKSRLAALPEEAWTANTFRQEALAAGAHATAQSILFKHEWHPRYNTLGFPHLEDLVRHWATVRGQDADRFMPINREETDLGPVYTFPDWNDWRDVISPIVDKAIASLRTARGVVTRLALVRLQPGLRIDPHTDGQPMAEKAHRIHVAIDGNIGVRYKIDGRNVTMAPGRAYDFNNRVRHSVRHMGRNPRVNLFVDYYPDPGLVISNPLARAGLPSGAQKA